MTLLCLSTQLGSVTSQVHQGHLSWEQRHSFPRGPYSTCWGMDRSYEISPRGTATVFCLTGHTPDSGKGPQARGSLPEAPTSP